MKSPDINDTLREKGPAAVRARHDKATRYVANGGLIIQSSADFVKGFVPPDYLVDGVLQRRFFYSLTAPTNGGKTAITLRIAAHVGLGEPIGKCDVGRGQVLFFAGENPDDVRMRWIALAEQMGFDIDAIAVHFIPGVFKLSALAARIQEEATARGGFSLVIVDTSAAFFEGENENDNVQAGVHARRLRGLVNLPGGPCVVTNCHPVKNAGDHNLLPRGGGAFVAEVDGNLVCFKDEASVELHWQGKFRGPDFPPMAFVLRQVTSERLKDSKGRLIPTVVASPLSEVGQQELAAVVRNDEDRLLAALAENGKRSQAELATHLGWFMATGEAYKVRVRRTLQRLIKQKLVAEQRDEIEVTAKGKEALKKLGKTSS